ncbi:hypothetical protein [Vitreimonas flagellata]|uniref:hypothetical protein n=1 Tax=Vitreimonas flagellata TaxID=2560861 RepID=UPI001075808A|nr:hypothetical protein [Vitreimonas flagellata]
MQNFFANWLGPLPPGVQSSPANTFQITGPDGKELTSLTPKQAQPLARQAPAQHAAPAPQAVAQQPAPPTPAPEPEKKKKGWF